MKKNKRAISPMISYILLISIGVVMGLLVYAWLKTYVPRESLECPDSTSLFVKDYIYIQNSQLNITIKNNGNFNIAGYFIRAANQSSEQKIAATDLSQRIDENQGGTIVGGAILFELSSEENSFTPNEEVTHVFDISGINEIYFIEITPLRIQQQESVTRTVTCGGAKIKEEIN